MKRILIFFVAFSVLSVYQINMFSMGKGGPQQYRPMQTKQKGKGYKKRPQRNRIQTIRIKPRYLSKRVFRGVVTYTPDTDRRQPGYTTYKFRAQGFIKNLGQPNSIKSPVTIRIRIRYIKRRIYKPKRGQMPIGGFRNKTVYANVLTKIGGNSKKDKTEYRTVDETLTITIRPDKVTLNKSMGKYVYKHGYPYRRRATFKRYLFSIKNFKQYINPNAKAAIKARIKVYRMKIHTWYPKNPRANYPIGGFKTIYYYARILSASLNR